MCNGDKMLTVLKQTQCRQKELRCLVNSKCWCMKVQTRLVHDGDDCMSPQDMLDLGVVLPTADRAYLESLTDLKFIRNGE